MTQITRMGMDVAKPVFQIHGVEERGHTVLRRRISRTQRCPFFAQLRPCLVGIEACGSAHHGARTLATWGHDVRLIAPQFVAPYRKNDKHDGNDAEAIGEAVGRPHMRFVPVKDVGPQAVLTVHRARAAPGGGTDRPGHPDAGLAGRIRADRVHRCRRVAASAARAAGVAGAAGAGP